MLKGPHFRLAEKLRSDTLYGRQKSTAKKRFARKMELAYAFFAEAAQMHLLDSEFHIRWREHLSLASKIAIPPQPEE